MLRHNEVRDFMRRLLSKFCNNIEIEPKLQHVTQESLPYNATTLSKMLVLTCWHVAIRVED